MLKKIGKYNLKSMGKFFYDGCHKIYIIEDFSDIGDMINNCEWSMDDLHSIDELEETILNSCPLVFINNVKLTKQYLTQEQKTITLTYDDHKTKINIRR